MSDDPEGAEYEVSPEDMRRWRAREERVAIAIQGIDVDRDMTSNGTILSLQRAVRARFDAAIEQLCEVSPTDHRSISALLVDVKTFVILRRTFEDILSRGREAERSLRDEEKE